MHHLRSYQLAVQFYRIAKGIELPGHLKDQLRRAASSVALNLSEGTGKRTGKDRGRFFFIAMGSIRECQAVTELEPEAFNHQTRDLLYHLAASVYKLTRTTTNPPASRRPPTATRNPLPQCSRQSRAPRQKSDQLDLFTAKNLHSSGLTPAILPSRVSRRYPRRRKKTEGWK